MQKLAIGGAMFGGTLLASKHPDALWMATYDEPWDVVLKAPRDKARGRDGSTDREYTYL